MKITSEYYICMCIIICEYYISLATPSEGGGATKDSHCSENCDYFLSKSEKKNS